MVERVSRADLRKMKIGETRAFHLPSAEAINSGKTAAWQMKWVLNCDFVCESDYANKILLITKREKQS